MMITLGCVWQQLHVKHGSDCVLFDLARPGPKSGSQQTLSVDATRQFVAWREGFLRAPHGGETGNSVANTLLPGGGKMARGALAAGCHARQLGNIHLGTGAVARPLAGRILMYATACSHCSVWRQVCFHLMAGSFYYKFVWRRECGTAIDPPNLLMEGGRCAAPYYSPAAEQILIVFMVVMAWCSLLEFCSCAPLIQIWRQRVGNMISCCSYFGLDFVVKITSQAVVGAGSFFLLYKGPQASARATGASASKGPCRRSCGRGWESTLPAPQTGTATDEVDAFVPPSAVPMLGPHC